MSLSKDTGQRCHQCRHYYVTHDVHFPYGCRQLDFKSAREPQRDVLASSGVPCMYFERRETRR